MTAIFRYIVQKATRASVSLMIFCVMALPGGLQVFSRGEDGHLWLANTRPPLLLVYLRLVVLTVNLHYLGRNIRIRTLSKSRS